MSNKTLKENAKKTKLAPKYIGVIVVAFAAALLLSIAATVSFKDSHTATAPVSSSSTCAGLETTDGCYALERRDTNTERAMGLSGRDGLADRSGMLFVFDRSERSCMWMKDMNFSIDIVWLDAAKKITKIEPNLGPDTYPTLYCQEDTKYVLELPVGTVQKLQLSGGQQLTF